MEETIDPVALKEEVLAAALREEWPRPVSADLVVVFSAPPSLHLEDQRAREANPENTFRIELGVALAKYYQAPLCLNGDKEQLPFMAEIARERGMGSEWIIPLNCGSREVANTKTQFEVLRSLFADSLDLALVTSSYYQPRLDRTAHKQLSPVTRFRTIAVPRSVFRFDLEAIVQGEVRRILAYAGNDIAFAVPAARLLPTE